MSKPTRPNGLARKSLPITAIVLLTLPLIGCGERLDCSTEETRNLVLQIAEESFREAIVLPADQPYPGLKLSLANIITREKDKNKAMCAAKLHMTIPTHPRDMQKTPPNYPPTERDTNITYRLERTDDGRLYATVYGL